LAGRVAEEPSCQEPAEHLEPPQIFLQPLGLAPACSDEGARSVELRVIRGRVQGAAALLKGIIQQSQLTEARDGLAVQGGIFRAPLLAALEVPGRFGPSFQLETDDR